MNLDDAREFVTDVVRETTFSVQTRRKAQLGFPEEEYLVHATLGQWVLAFYASLPQEGQAKIRELIGMMRHELPSRVDRDN